MNTIIIIPTFNESQNISVLLEALLGLDMKLSILVIDDNSPDATAEIVKRMQAWHSNLFLIVRDKKKGLGSAYKEGFEFALEKGFDYICQMDADLSHPSTALPHMFALLDKNDLVLGSRYVKGGGVSNWPFKRRMLSRMANIFSKVLLGIFVCDMTSGFKCMKRNLP